MTTVLNYIHDPLCGWCHGAVTLLARLRQLSGVHLALHPSGLFSGDGARPMTDDFAAYAWSNDQRIARLTGQPFSERYRKHVLDDRVQRFDSGPATIAITAVAATDPTREFDALMAIQRARYVDGRDVTSPAVLANVLAALDLDDAAAMTTQPDAALREAVRVRIRDARAVLQPFGVSGVPRLVADADGRRRLLDIGTAHADPQSLIDQLRAA